MSNWSTFEPNTAFKHRQVTPEEGEDGHHGIQQNMRNPIVAERVSLQLQARFRLSTPPVVHYEKPKSWSIWPF